MYFFYKIFKKNKDEIFAIINKKIKEMENI
jgi:hypothetical protein